MPWWLPMPRPPRTPAPPWTVPDADVIFQEVTALAARWDNPATTPADRAMLKDQLRYLHGRAQWLANPEQRRYVQAPLDALWQKALQL